MLPRLRERQVRLFVTIVNIGKRNPERKQLVARHRYLLTQIRMAEKLAAKC